MTYLYKAYNLHIQSGYPLLELFPIPSATAIDVHIETALDAYPDLDRTHPVQVVPDGVVYRMYPVGVIYVQGGERIVLQTIPESEPALVSDMIVNHGMALILHQRGHFILHASAVAVEGGAVVFAGESGMGKSTTAAVFDQRGYHILSDDVVALDLRAAPPVMFPAFPQVKLLPDAIASLYGDSAALPPQFEDARKHLYRTQQTFPQTPQRIKAIYLLERGDSTAIEAIAPRQAMLDLFPHSYIARQVKQFGVDLLKGTRTEGVHFMNIARLVGSIPVRRLRRTFAPGELAALPDLIQEDLTAL